MEHVVRIQHKCHIFFRKFVALVLSLEVPSGMLTIEDGIIQHEYHLVDSVHVVPHLLDLVGPLLDGELDVKVDLVQTEFLEPPVPHPGHGVSQVAHTALLKSRRRWFLLLGHRTSMSLNGRRRCRCWWPTRSSSAGRQKGRTPWLWWWWGCNGVLYCTCTLLY